MPPSLCWMMMSGPTPGSDSGMAATGGMRRDVPTRRAVDCVGNGRGGPADCDRCTRGRDDGPATWMLDPARDGVAEPMPEPEPRARAACASACASSILRYRCEEDSVAAGDVEFGVSSATSGGTSVRATDGALDTAEIGNCDCGERIIDTAEDCTAGDVR